MTKRVKAVSIPRQVGRLHLGSAGTHDPDAIVIVFRVLVISWTKPPDGGALRVMRA
jgi:hypothetical protein